MTKNKRYVAIDDGEIYYITDTQGLKTLDDYINEFKKPEYELFDEEVLSVAEEEYWQMIYENSMTSKENVDTLNQLLEENEELKQFKQQVFDLIDKKLEENPYLTLSEKWNPNCELYHSCRENHEKNVAYGSKHQLLQELKKELSE